MNSSGAELKDRGFTLIELIVAISIISIGLMSVIPLLMSAYKVETQTFFRVRAQFVMAEKMDELLSPETPTVTGGTDYIDAQTGQVYASAPSSVPVVITRTWGLVNTSVTPTQPLYLLTVATTYTDQGGARIFTSYSKKGN